MFILYATDLHGNKTHYEKLLDLARDRDISIVIAGADLLPKTGNFTVEQRRFIKDWFSRYLESVKAQGIKFYAMQGNDDLLCYRPMLQKLEDEGLLTLTDMKKVPFADGYELIGYNHVPVTPFGIKDHERLDYPDAPMEPQNSISFLSDSEGDGEGTFIAIPDLHRYFESLPTIAKELERLPVPSNPRKTIYMIHAPPERLSLDVCSTGNRVGSRSVYDFIQEKQPCMTLHGHIHESPRIAFCWCALVRNTWAFQPGQRDDKLVALVLDLDNLDDAKYISI